MFELRWLEIDEFKKVLQYRTIQKGELEWKDGSLVMNWTEWKDVPIVMEAP